MKAFCLTIRWIEKCCKLHLISLLTFYLFVVARFLYIFFWSCSQVYSLILNAAQTHNSLYLPARFSKLPLCFLYALVPTQRPSAAKMEYWINDNSQMHIQIWLLLSCLFSLAYRGIKMMMMTHVQRKWKSSLRTAVDTWHSSYCCEILGYESQEEASRVYLI